MAVLGLRFCVRAFSSCGKREPLFISVHALRLSLSRPLLLRSTGSRRTGSVIVAHRPSCSVACGIFPDQGSNPCPLHWQADSQPLRHQGSPPSLLITLSLINIGDILISLIHSVCISKILFFLVPALIPSRFYLILFSYGPQESYIYIFITPCM